MLCRLEIEVVSDGFWGDYDNVNRIVENSTKIWPQMTECAHYKVRDDIMCGIESSTPPSSLLPDILVHLVAF